MCILFAQFFVATTQRQAQIALQLLQAIELLPHISQLRLQMTAHRRARLHPTSAQTQKAPNFAEFESQSLYAADKRQRFDVTFPILAKSPLCPRSALRS
jgi:hypothetical protein